MDQAKDVPVVMAQHLCGIVFAQVTVRTQTMKSENAALRRFLKRDHRAFLLYEQKRIFVLSPDERNERFGFEGTRRDSLAEEALQTGEGD